MARFFNESGRATTNILSRVTGGQPSNIFGTIQTAGFGSAALWLINPAGIVFGPTASLNVGGSVHFSTADYLRLGSGNDRFYADLGKTSQLTSAEVTAFGFLGERPAGTITVQGGNALTVSEGKALSLVGGDIMIVGRTLSAPGGQINVASVNSAAEAFLNPVGQSPGVDIVSVGQTRTGQRPTLAEGTVLIRGGALVGTVTLGNNAVLKTDAVSGGKAGNIEIEAKTLNAGPGTLISAGGGSAAQDGSVVLTASNQVALSSVALISGSTASGDTANVTITTPGAVSLADGTTIVTNSTTGNAGSVLIQSGQFVMENSGIEAKTSAPIQIGTTPSTETEFGQDFIACCKGGAVDIAASSISLTGGVFAARSDQTAQQVSGITIWTNNQGDITLGGRTITLDNAKIFTDGQNLSLVMSGVPNATGSVHIQGREGQNSRADHVTLRNDSRLETAGYYADYEPTGGRRGGVVSVSTVELDMSNSTIVTYSNSIFLDASGNVTSGGGNWIRALSTETGLGTVTLSAGEGIALSRNDQLETMLQHISGAPGDGRGLFNGPISLRAPMIFLSGTSMKTEAGGAVAGDINLHGNDIEVSGASTISTNNGGTAPSRPLGGSAGNVNISGWVNGTSARTIRLADGSAITSNSGFNEFSIGTPGNVTLDAKMIVFDNAKTTANHTGSAATTGTGDINIRAAELQILNGSSIEAAALGKDVFIYPPANGGNIRVQADRIISSGSKMIAASTGSGGGGNIMLNASDLVQLRDSQIVTSVTGGVGAGGNITIDTTHPRFVVLQNSQILAQANQGRGGAIFLVGGVLLTDPASVINADSKNQTLNGTVNIQAPIQQLSGAIAPLPQAFAVATNLYGQRCATQKGGQFSSFVQGARDGVPPQPGDLIPSPLLLESDGASPSLGSQSSLNLAAVRLGLPGFDHPSPVTFMSFAGCRS